MIAKVRQFGGRFIKFLVDMEFRGETSVGEALAARNQMRCLGDDFIKTFKAERIIAAVHGPLDNLRLDTLDVHMWLTMEGVRPKGSREIFFDERTEEQLVSFFHDHGLDLVRRSFPRRS